MQLYIQYIYIYLILWELDLSLCCAVVTEQNAHDCCKACSLCSSTTFRLWIFTVLFSIVVGDSEIILTVRRVYLFAISAALCRFLLCVSSEKDKFCRYLFVVGVISLKCNKLVAFCCMTSACSFHWISNLCTIHTVLYM